jgi:hypothetical protein
MVRPGRRSGKKVGEAMNISLKLILIAGIGLGGLGEAASSGLALPRSGLDPALAPAADAAKGVENIRWICGPYGGCRWVPGWRRYGWWGLRYGYGYWGPRHFWGPYGYYGWGGPYYGHRYYW